MNELLFTLMTLKEVKESYKNRNKLCPCGSGKKTKKCCIDKLEYELKLRSK